MSFEFWFNIIPELNDSKHITKLQWGGQVSPNNVIVSIEQKLEDLSSLKLHVLSLHNGANKTLLLIVVHVVFSKSQLLLRIKKYTNPIMLLIALFFALAENVMSECHKKNCG